MDVKIYKECDDLTKEKITSIKGIIRCTNYYVYRRKLYNDIILSLKFFFDKEDNIYMRTNVTNGTYEQYVPFYNKSLRNGHTVFEKVINKYNKIMDELVDENVVEVDKIIWY